MHFLSRLSAAVTAITLLAMMSFAPSVAHATSGEPSTATHALTASSTFSDVPPGTPFSTEITWLADRGVSTGWSDGTFRPYQAVTRDAMAAFMYRLAGSPSFPVPAVSPFADVPTSYQFYVEIAWLDHAGISTGWNTAQGREFRPWNLITRDAMAAFLYRYEGSPVYAPVGDSPFLDVAPNSSFSREIRWLASRGISTGWDVGYGCRNYQPFGNVARDAMAAFMYRATIGGTTPIQEGTCAPPSGPSQPPASGPTVPDAVTPGAFCKTDIAGWYGRSAQGVLMQCRTSPTDDRLRWRAV